MNDLEEDSEAFDLSDSDDNGLEIFLNNIRVKNENFLGKSSANASSDIAQKFVLPQRYAGSEDSVWIEYAGLAAKYSPLNLGQGFPDYASTPKHVTQGLADTAGSGNNLMHQYTRGFGHMKLVNVLAKLYSKLISREINPMTEILVTYGGYEALFCIIAGHVDVGDEVIIMDPFFDCYEPMVKSCSGVCKFIPIKSNSTSDTPSASEWVWDKKAFENLFNKKTKMIIVNTPHNPIGKVFTMEELTQIADLCKKWNVLCLSDEVYEWQVYEPKKHIRMATLPGMWERTITIGSAGKTFSVTGWKLGWAYGPANLMVNLNMVHQNCVYVGSTPIQEAAGLAFEKEFAALGTDQSYFEQMPNELRPKRDYIVKFLLEAGFKPTVPDGGYFTLADWSGIESKIDLSSEKDKFKDYRITKWMTKNIGLQGIPPTAFYSAANKPLGENFIRYCFFKKQETLEKGAEILKKWKERDYKK